MKERLPKDWPKMRKDHDLIGKKRVRSLTQIYFIYSALPYALQEQFCYKLPTERKLYLLPYLSDCTLKIWIIYKDQI